MAFPNKSTENIYMERENILFANKLLHTRLAECHQACCAIWQTKIGREEKPSNLQDHHQDSRSRLLHISKLKGYYRFTSWEFSAKQNPHYLSVYFDALWLMWCSWWITYIQNLHCMSEHFFFLSAILWLIWRSCRIGCTKSYLQARATIIGGIAFATASLYLHL